MQNNIHNIDNLTSVIQLYHQERTYKSKFRLNTIKVTYVSLNFVFKIQLFWSTQRGTRPKIYWPRLSYFKKLLGFLNVHGNKRLFVLQAWTEIVLERRYSGSGGMYCCRCQECSEAHDFSDSSARCELQAFKYPLTHWFTSHFNQALV